MKREEELDLYWYALDESCPLALINENGRITYVNNRFSELTGYKMDDTQCTLPELLHPGSHHQGLKNELAEQIRSGKTWRRKICLRNRDGQPLCLQVSFYPGPEDEPLRQNLMIFQQGVFLADESSIPANSALEELSSMAHDLRNPLYNILALCGLLIDTPLNEKQIDYVTKLKGSASLVSGMLDNLLLSCLSDKKEALNVSLPFNLIKTIESFPGIISEKNSALANLIRLETDENLPAEVFGNESQIISLAQDIASFLGSGQELRSLKILALKDRVEGDHCDISFFFFGQFSAPFIENPSASNATPENGVPRLEAIRSRISLLGGKVLLEEENLQAFYFHFLVPFALSPAKESTLQPLPAEEPAPELPTDARVLVAEDVELNQLVMKHQFQKIGLEADFVKTGFNVLERLRIFPYDLVLMDVQMPGMNGLQTIEAIRSDQTKPYHQIPIIGITASIGGNAREQCLSAGADDFVPKPYNLDDLWQKLKKLIAAYRLKKNSTKEKPPKENNMTETEKYFDLSYLEEISEGDRDFSATMISYFIDNTPSVIENLQKKVLDQDWDEVRQIAHKLKPQVVYMGIHQIEEDIEQVEHSAQHRENLEVIPSLVDKTASIISKAIAQLEEELKKFN